MDCLVDFLVTFFFCWKLQHRRREAELRERALWHWSLTLQAKVSVVRIFLSYFKIRCLIRSSRVLAHFQKKNEKLLKRSKLIECNWLKCQKLHFIRNGIMTSLLKTSFLTKGFKPPAALSSSWLRLSQTTVHYWIHIWQWDYRCFNL